jgi:ring-1,2-phenylacetyl-CoA epoxidase subunit PaaD
VVSASIEAEKVGTGPIFLRKKGPVPSFSAPVPELADRIDVVPIELAEDRISRSDPGLAPIWDLLEKVKDPEIPVISVRELGVLRALHRDGDTLRVIITPTYSGCPAMHAMEQDIRATLEAAGICKLRIETRLAPAWTTDWIEPAARERLREYGIAPPARDRDGEDAQVACPQCGSPRTERISEFGSTACKALYRCTECLEPFDYFKRL